jgi:uncharacterized membrane protein YccC
MPFLNTFYQHIRQDLALARTKPAMEAGLRCAVAMAAPIALASLVGQVRLGTIVAVAAWFSLLADVGGTYAEKARAMLGATTLIAASVLIAGLSRVLPWLSLLLLFCWIFVSGFAPPFGATPAQISFLSSVTFLVGLAFTRPETAVSQAVLYFLGGLWGTFLSLLVWSIHPNRPVREAVNRVYEKIAELLTPENIKRSRDDIGGQAAVAATLRQLTAEIDSARALWDAVRTRRYGLSNAERLLLIAVTNSQQLVRSTLSFLSLASQVAFEQRELEPLLTRLTIAFSGAIRALSAAILNRRRSPDLAALQEALQNLNRELEQRRTNFSNESAKYRPLLNLGKCVRQAFVLSGQLSRLAELLGHPETIAVDQLGKTVSRLTAPRGLWSIIRPQLNLDSATTRYALRLAAVTLLAQMIGNGLPGGRGYWVPITTLVILRPDYGGTFSRTIQRVIGTMIGGIFGAVLGLVVQDTTWQIFLIAALAFFAFTVRPLNYGFFTLALTPLFMILLNIVDKGNWQISVVRIMETWLGAALSLIGALTVFPSWQRAQLPALAVQLIRSIALYFQQVSKFTRSDHRQLEEIDRLHLTAELASANAEAALQRLQSDPLRFRHAVQDWTTLLLYLRNLINSISTLAEHSREMDRNEPAAEVSAVTNAISATLENLARAIETEKPLALATDLESGPGALRVLVDDLHTARLKERELGGGAVTQTLRAVRENTFLSLELDQIVNKLVVLQEIANRLAADGLGPSAANDKSQIANRK